MFNSVFLYFLQGFNNDIKIFKNFPFLNPKKILFVSELYKTQINMTRYKKSKKTP